MLRICPLSEEEPGTIFAEGDVNVTALKVPLVALHIVPCIYCTTN